MRQPNETTKWKRVTDILHPYKTHPQTSFDIKIFSSSCPPQVDSNTCICIGKKYNMRIIGDLKHFSPSHTVWSGSKRNYINLWHTTHITKKNVFVMHILIETESVWARRYIDIIKTSGEKRSVWQKKSNQQNNKLVLQTKLILILNLNVTLFRMEHSDFQNLKLCVKMSEKK